jgi:hypothetical protein
MKNLKVIANGLLICAIVGFVATGCGQKPSVETPSEELQPQEQQTLEQKPVQPSEETKMENKMEKQAAPEEKKTEKTEKTEKE